MSWNDYLLRNICAFLRSTVLDLIGMNSQKSILSVHNCDMTRGSQSSEVALPKPYPFPNDLDTHKASFIRISIRIIESSQLKRFKFYV